MAKAGAGTEIAGGEGAAAPTVRDMLGAAAEDPEKFLTLVLDGGRRGRGRRPLAARLAPTASAALRKAEAEAEGPARAMERASERVARLAELPRLPLAGRGGAAPPPPSSLSPPSSSLSPASPRPSSASRAAERAMAGKEAALRACEAAMQAILASGS
jgi:hypothetical protein